MTKGVSAIAKATSVYVPVRALGLSRAAAHEVDDLDTVAVADQRPGERVPLENHQVVLDRNPSGIDSELLEQLRHRDGVVELVGFPVERDLQLRGPGIVT